MPFRSGSFRGNDESPRMMDLVVSATATTAEQAAEARQRTLPERGRRAELADGEVDVGADLPAADVRSVGV